MSQNNRILLVVDGSNSFYMNRTLNWTSDPQKLLEYVAKWGTSIEARYYLSMSSNAENDGRERFRTALAYMGYSVIPIFPKQVMTAEGLKDKSNADIHIAIDTILSLPNYDTLVLVSGDGDFAYLVECLKIYGKHVKVIAVRSMAARDLVEMVGASFIDMDTLRSEVERIE